MFFGIGASEDWASVAAVDKGWSSDKKFLVETRAGDRLLLRLSEAGRYEEKQREYAFIQKTARLGFPMSLPVDFGQCWNDQVYMLLTWVEGQDLETVLPELSPEKQYALGRQAGIILRRIHEMPLEKGDLPGVSKREKKLRQLASYESSGVRVADDGGAIRFVRDNIHMIWRQKPVYLHGDFHPGNLIYRADGTLGVIDFNRWEVGDPYEEFYKLESFARELSVPYCVGQIDGYFGDAVPDDFWPVLAVYVAHASLYSICWAEKFGQAEMDGMVRRWHQARVDYDGFRRVVPRWYADFSTRAASNETQPE